MTTFEDLLDDVDGLCRAFSAIESSISEKQRDHLRELYMSSDGEPSERVGNNVVKSRTRVSCSRIGSLLTRHLGGAGPAHSMMWIGYIPSRHGGRERWKMRPEIREALRLLNWFDPGPIPSGSTSEPGIVSADQQTEIEARAERFALTKVRTEQAAFRKAVFQACGGRCLISGNPVLEVLEAAHLKGRSWQEGHNAAQDGILLRRDLHALYDNDLLAIDENGRIAFHKDIAEHYREFLGKTVSRPS